MTMKIHHAPNTRSVRTVWLFEELGLPYDIQFHKLGDPEMRSPEYRKIHPMGRVPALEDGDVTILESGAIVEYVLSKYGEGRMRPTPDSANFAGYLQWLHYAEGMIMPPMNTLVVETILLPPERRTEINVKRSTKLLGQMLTAVNTQLSDKAFLVGSEISAADFMTGHAVITSRRLGIDMSAMPNLKSYAERLSSRQAFVRAELL